MATRAVFLMLLLILAATTPALSDTANIPIAGPPPIWSEPLGKADTDEQEQRMAELGRQLFYDPRLSANDCMSCASCHRPELGFTDGKQTAIGVYGDAHSRNTPTLTNVAYAASLTWLDAGVHSLSEQASVPMFNTAPPELGLTSEQQLVEKLRSDQQYPTLFARAFPEKPESLTLDTITQSLAAFERTLISYQSPYDRYVYRGEHEALSESAKRGLRLFYSRRLGCVDCHNGWNFSAPVRTVANPEVESVFHNTGLEQVESDDQPVDFKTPTLRNIALTAPYMHNGSLATLEDVIQHYEEGGGGAVVKSALLRQFNLTDVQRADLIEFLHHLTDEQFIKRAVASDPDPDRVLPAHCTP